MLKSGHEGFPRIADVDIQVLLRDFPKVMYNYHYGSCRVVPPESIMTMYVLPLGLGLNFSRQRIKRNPTSRPTGKASDSAATFDFLKIFSTSERSS